MEQKWVQAWGMSHAGMSLLGYRGNDRTFRLTVHSESPGVKSACRSPTVFPKSV